MSSKTLNRIVKENNLPTRKNTHTHAHLVSEIYKAYLNSIPLSVLSSTFNLSEKEISKVCSAERKRTVLLDYKKRMKIKDIMDKHHISNAYIYQILHSEGVTPGRFNTENRLSTVSDKDTADAVIYDYRESNLSVEQICDRYNITTAAFRKIIYDGENSYRRKNDNVRTLDKELKEGFSDRYSTSLSPLSVIMNEYKISRCEAEGIIRELNLKEKRGKVKVEMLKRYKNGVSVGVLCSDYGVSKTTFYRIVKKYEGVWGSENK